jgi:hypothetical protein
MWDLWWTKWHWGHVLSEYFGFICQSQFHQMFRTYLSFGAGKINQIVADVPSESHATPQIKKKTTSLSEDKTLSKMFRKQADCKSDPRMKLRSWRTLPRLHSQPWRWRRHVSPKRSYRRTRLYENTAIWTVTALKHSKLMLHWCKLQVEMAYQNNVDTIGP